MSRVNMSTKVSKSKHKKLKMNLAKDELTYQELSNKLLDLYLNGIIKVKDGFLVVDVDTGESKKVVVEDGQLTITDYLKEE